MNDLVRKDTAAGGAVKIASEIERAIREGRLASGAQVPPVRTLAAELGVNPATVASAYRMLQARALLVSEGRRGTRVTHRPLAGARRPPIVPTGARNLADGNPDPGLLPSFRKVLRALDYEAHLYGEPMMHAGLITLMQREMEKDGVAPRTAECCVVSGAMDGIDRLITEQLKPGDLVAVEDPGFTGHHDLIASRGLSLAPVRMDAEGMLPDALAEACARGARAVLVTPRAQSPTGAALSAERAAGLRRVLAAHRHKRKVAEEILIIEDDHASFICRAPYHPLHEAGSRWAHLRSFSKSFNPDLRLAVMTGDEQTMMRLLDRLVVVERWVSHIVQSAAHALLADRTVRAEVRKAGRIYDDRRAALIDALASHGLHAPGSSGYNVWLPVDEETNAVQALAAAGWAVAAGERFRLGTPPGVRITASRLPPEEAAHVARAAAAALRPRHRGTTA